jgi:hypothetical protein
VSSDAVDRLVRSGDQPGDVRLGMAFLVMREVVELVDRVGTGQKSCKWPYKPRLTPVNAAT